MIEFSEFKGNKIITLKRKERDKYPFSFGVYKAKLILEHLEDIKKFVEENDKYRGDEYSMQEIAPKDFSSEEEQ